MPCAVIIYSLSESQLIYYVITVWNTKKDYWYSAWFPAREIVYKLLIRALQYQIFSAAHMCVQIVIINLVRLIMTGNIVAVKNNGGYKYGGIAEKPPNLTLHN